MGGKGGRCVRLTTLPPSCAVVMKSGNLNLLEPSGPLQACNGTALSFTFTSYNYNFLNSWSFLSSSIKTLRFITPSCSLPWPQNPPFHRSRAIYLLSCPPNNPFMTHFNTALPTVPTSLLWGRDIKFLQNFPLIYQTEQCHIPQDCPYNVIISHDITEFNSLLL
jgi:hypothetical protein